MVRAFGIRLRGVDVLDLKLVRDLRAMLPQVATIALLIASGISVLVMSGSNYLALLRAMDDHYRNERFAELQDATSPHHADAIGQHHRLLEVVGDMNEGDTDRPVQTLEFGLQRLLELNVESREGFVEKQELWRGYHRTGQRHALLLAAGERPRKPIEINGFQFHQGDHLVHPLSDFPGRNLPQPQGKADVLGHRHVGKQCKLLKHHAGRTKGGGNAGHVPTLDADRAGCRGLEACDLLQQRGLATSRWADQRDEFALLHAKRNTFQRLIASIGLVDVVDVEDRRIGHRSRHTNVNAGAAIMLLRPFRYSAAASSSCQIASISSMLGAMRCIWELSHAVHM